MIIPGAATGVLITGSGGAFGLSATDPARPDLAWSRPAYAQVTGVSCNEPSPPAFISVTAVDGRLQVTVLSAAPVDGYQIGISADTRTAPLVWWSTSSGSIDQEQTGGPWYLWARSTYKGAFSLWSVYGQVRPGDDEWRLSWSDEGVSGTDHTAYPYTTVRYGHTSGWQYASAGTGMQRVHQQTAYVDAFGLSTLQAAGGVHGTRIDAVLGVSHYHAKLAGVAWGFDFATMAAGPTETPYYGLAIRKTATPSICLDLYHVVGQTATLIQSCDVTALCSVRDPGFTATYYLPVSVQAQENVVTVTSGGTTLMMVTDETIPWTESLTGVGLWYQGSSNYGYATTAYMDSGVEDYLRIYARDHTGEAETVTPGSPAHNGLDGRSDAGCHPASAVAVTPAGGIAATDVAAALVELDTETVKLTGDQTVAGAKTFSESVVLSKSVKSTTGTASPVKGSPVRIMFPGGGGYDTHISSNPGAIKITLPVSWTTTFFSFTVRVYEFGSGGGCNVFDVLVSGYNTASAWYEVSAHILNCVKPDNHTIRFGHDGSKCVVYIGELASSWVYPQIYILDVVLGYNTSSAASWETGWAIGFESSAFQNVTKTISNCQIGLYHAGAKIWNEGNDGAGSGLDACSVDGIQGAAIAQKITSTTSITVGPSGRDFTTIQAALDSLKGKVLAALVAINVDAGDYAPFSYGGQPYGRLIQVVGDTRVAAGAQGIATGSISKDGDNCTITLTAAPPSDYGAGDYITVADCTTAANVGRFPIVSVDTVNFTVTYVNSSGVAEAVKTGTRVIWNANRTITNSGTGLVAIELGSDINVIEGFTLLGLSTSQGIGFSAPILATITHCHAYGILVGFSGYCGGAVTYNYVAAVKCTYGIYHLNGCSIMMYNANAHNCTYGLLITDGSVASNTGSTVTITGNTAGVHTAVSSAISLHTLKVVCDNTTDYSPTPGGTGGNYGSYIKV